MVLNVLLNASQVWSPSTKEDIIRIERVQKIATMYINNVNIWDGVSYKDRLITL